MLLIAHIAVAVSALGTAIVLAVLGLAGLSGDDPRTIYPAAHLVVQYVEQPLAVAALVTGITLALTGGWGLLRFWWVSVKLAVTAVATVVIVFLLEPGLASAADAATAAGGSPGHAQQVRIAVGPLVAAAFLVVNVALGVLKPGRRIGGAQTG